MLDRELFALLDATADAAFALSEQGEIRSWNKAAEQLFGYRADQVIGKSCAQVLRGTGTLGTRVCHQGCSVLECAGQQTPIPNFDMNVMTRSGQRRWVNISTLVSRNKRNASTLVIHLARDISEQKRTEELTRKMFELSQQLGNLEQPLAHLPVIKPAPVSPLSQRERHILRLFAEGKTAEHIAGSLNISLQTLRNHLHHVNRKLRTHNRLEAVMHALQRKLI